MFVDATRKRDVAALHNLHVAAYMVTARLNTAASSCKTHCCSYNVAGCVDFTLQIKTKLVLSDRLPDCSPEYILDFILAHKRQASC